MVRLEGLEPPAHSLEGCCSIRLSYRRLDSFYHCCPAMSRFEYFGKTKRIYEKDAGRMERWAGGRGKRKFLQFEISRMKRLEGRERRDLGLFSFLFDFFR